MPQPIAQAVHAFAVSGLVDFPVCVEVGDIGQCLVAQPALLEGADAGLGVQLAVQALGKGQVLLVREVLVTEDEQGVLVHAGANLQQRLGVSHLAEINGADLSRELGMKFAKCQGHGKPSFLESCYTISAPVLAREIVPQPWPKIDSPIMRGIWCGFVTTTRLLNEEVLYGYRESGCLVFSGWHDRA